MYALVTTHMAVDFRYDETQAKCVGERPMSLLKLENCMKDYKVGK